MKRLMPLAIALLLSACAGFGHINNPADMVGQGTDALVAAWGKPVEVQHNGGVETYTYKSVRTAAPVGASPLCSADTRDGLMRCTPDIFPTRPEAELYCETTFTLQGGIVSSWQRRGNACPAGK